METLLGSPESSDGSKSASMRELAYRVTCSALTDDDAVVVERFADQLSSALRLQANT